jgi:hypothetical protein
MDVWAMKKEVLICDVCKNSMAVGKCDVCGHDVCKNPKCKVEKTLKFDTNSQATITKFMFCLRCNKNLKWQDDLSSDLKEIIIDRIKARNILNVVEKQ